MILLAAVLGTGCYVQDQTRYVATAPGPAAEGADLVEVSPGVEVIADYNEPVFFADDYYWVNRGGVWYSSTWYGGGWGRAGYVSPRIYGIGHPEGYAHYRPNGYVRGYHGGNRGGNVNHGGGSYHSRPAVRGRHR